MGYRHRYRYKPGYRFRFGCYYKLGVLEKGVMGLIYRALGLILGGFRLELLVCFHASVLVMRGLKFGVYTRAPDSWKLPFRA